MKEIKLFKTESGWMADFVGDEEVKAAFGTTVIPTAFTAKAPAREVVNTLVMLNPECAVSVI